MKSVYNFVVTPKGERYNNKKKVGDAELILNTEIFNHQYVNREAVVISIPIVGDTGIKPEKITKEQLDRVQDSVNKINRAQLELGSMELKKHEMMHNIAGFRDELTLLQNEFEQEYGTFDINIQDGTINYEKENGEVNKKD